MILAGGPFGLGPLELVIILLVLVMLFGATRLADLGGSLGRGIKEFRKEIGGDDDAPAPPANPPAATMAPPPAASANGSETISAVKCPSCGTLNPAGARHCSQCGTALTTAPVS